MSRFFYKFPISTDLLKFSDMELVNDDVMTTMITIYCPPKIENPQSIELFVELAEPKLVQIVPPSSCGGTLQAPENPNYGGCSYNNPISGPHFEKHPEVLGTIVDGDEGFDNEDQSYHDFEEISNLDLDEVPDDINDEGAMEGQDVHPQSVRKTRFDIVIWNDLGAHMSSIEPDMALLYEFPEYLDIVPTHLMETNSEVGELYVGQQFDNKKDCVYAIK
ncbi:hypothetical protein V6Z11_D08G129200 [Gossypium hirsutum]